MTKTVTTNSKKLKFKHCILEMAPHTQINRNLFFILVPFLLLNVTRGHEKTPYCCRSQDRVFDCAHCNLTSIPTGFSPNTEVLKLDWNNINRIPGYIFLNMTLLKTLIISNNPLKSVVNSSFEGRFWFNCSLSEIWKYYSTLCTKNKQN